MHADCMLAAGPLQIKPGLPSGWGLGGGLILPFSNARQLRETVQSRRCQPHTIKKR